MVQRRVLQLYSQRTHCPRSAATSTVFKGTNHMLDNLHEEQSRSSSFATATRRWTQRGEGSEERRSGCGNVSIFDLNQRTRELQSISVDVACIAQRLGQLKAINCGGNERSNNSADSLVVSEVH